MGPGRNTGVVPLATGAGQARRAEGKLPRNSAPMRGHRRKSSASGKKLWIDVCRDGAAPGHRMLGYMYMHTHTYRAYHKLRKGPFVGHMRYCTNSDTCI